MDQNQVSSNKEVGVIFWLNLRINFDPAIVGCFKFWIKYHGTFCNNGVGLLNENMRERQCVSVFSDRTNPLDYLSDQDLASKFRLCQNAILFLVDILEPALASPTHWSHRVPLNLQVLSICITLQVVVFNVLWVTILT